MKEKNPWTTHNRIQAIPLLVTYKASIRSLFTYTAPIWSINISQRSSQKLQTIQNPALRIATGNVKLSAESHLHAPLPTTPWRVCYELPTNSKTLYNICYNITTRFQETAAAVRNNRIEKSVQNQAMVKTHLHAGHVKSKAGGREVAQNAAVAGETDVI